MTLSLAELADTRDCQNSLLDTTVTIERATREDDDQGGEALAFQTIADDIPARMMPARPDDARSAGESNIGGRRTVKVDYICTMRHGVDIDSGDRVLHAGRLYEVVYAGNPADSLGTATRASLRRV